jgi:hypothetical protein
VELGSATLRDLDAQDPDDHSISRSSPVGTGIVDAWRWEVKPFG